MNTKITILLPTLLALTTAQLWGASKSETPPKKEKPFWLDKVEFKNDKDKKCFFAIVKGDNCVVANLMWQDGLDVNAIIEQNEGLTPLMVASYRGVVNKKIVNLLLDSNADHNAVDKHGRTPLFLAAITGRSEIAKLLIQAGARAEDTDYFNADSVIEFLERSDLNYFAEVEAAQLGG